MKSPFDKVVKPQDKHKVSQAGSLSKKTAQSVPPETKKLENVVETETKTEDEKRRAEEAKQQKKEETSEERYMRVTISEEEENHLNRVFQLFINEQKQLEKETREKKHHTRNGIEDAEINEKREMEIGAGKSSIIKKDKKDKEEEYFEGKAVRAILSKLGVKEIREHDIEIMIWVSAGNRGS